MRMPTTTMSWFSERDRAADLGRGDLGEVQRHDERRAAHGDAEDEAGERAARRCWASAAAMRADGEDDRRR